MENKSIFNHTLSKLIGLILLFLSLSVCIPYGCSWALRVVGFHDELEAVEYVNSKDCESIMDDAAETAVTHMVTEYDEYSYFMNSDYVIKDHRNGKVVLDDRSEGETYEKEYQTYVIYNDDAYDANAVKTLDKDLNKDLKVYDVTVYLTKGLPHEDIFSNHQDLYYYVKAHAPNDTVLFAAGAIISLLLVVYEMCAAGKVRGKPGITLNFMDKIPYEIYIILFFFAEFGVISIFAILADANLSFNAQMKVMTNDFSAAGVVFTMFLMSTAARVKAGKWYHNTIIWKCWNSAKYLFRAIPAVPLMTISVCVWMIFVFVVSGETFDGGIAALNIIISLFIGAAAIYCAWAIKKLGDGMHEIIDGDLDYRFEPRDRKIMMGKFAKMADDMELVADGMKKGLEKQIKSEKLKAELITNVSHDIKTPLTSIINYVDLLQKEHTPEQEKEYITVLDRQSQRLKKLTEDVVEASKASTGNISVQMDKTNVKEILEQAYAEYEEKLQASDLSVIINVKDTPLYAHTDGRLLWRVLRNLLSNCAKYAMPGTRVYIDAERWNAKQVKITIKNTSKEALNVSADELMERFVRGDASRHTEGSGLGLNIARSLTELLHGTFHIKIDGDLFKSEVIIPVEEEH